MNIIDAGLKFTSALQRRRRTEYIVVHHAEAVSADVEQVHGWHKSNGWAGIGYNLYIRKDGCVYAGRGVEYVGAHAQGYNSVSVGVCCEGDYHNRDKTMPEAQYMALLEVVRWLKGKYPEAAIVGHGELMATNCPGRYFPLDKLKCDSLKEGLDMEKIAELEARLARLENKMVYNYIDQNMPDWARPTVQKLSDRGILKGDDNGGLGLTDETLRVLVVLDRAGAFAG